MYSWNDPDRAWETAKRLTNHDAWIEYERSIEFQDELHLDVIYEYEGSPADLDCLRNLRVPYIQTIACLDSLLITLGENGEVDKNPEALEVLLKMRNRYQDVKTRIDRFLENVASQKALLKRQIEKIANRPEDTDSTSKITNPFNDDTTSPCNTQEQKILQDSNSLLIAPQTAEDLVGQELTTKEVADACKCDTSTVRRYADEAAVSASWSTAKGYTLVVIGLHGTGGERYAIIDRKSGGKNGGWKFREVRTTSEKQKKANST